MLTLGLKKLRGLLTAYSQVEKPQNRAAILYQALLVAEETFPERAEVLRALRSKVRDLMIGVHWDVFNAYTRTNWELLGDDEYYQFRKLLTAMDEIVAALSLLVMRESTRLPRFEGGEWK